MVLGSDLRVLGMLGYVLSPKLCFDYLCADTESVLKLNNNLTYQLCICIVWACILYILEKCMCVYCVCECTYSQLCECVCMSMGREVLFLSLLY